MIFDVANESEVIKMENELHVNKEMYVPRYPLKFDPMGKLIIYNSEKFASKRRFFRFAIVPPALVLYCGARAI